MIKKLKNNTSQPGVWQGQTIHASEEYEITDLEKRRWSTDQQVIASIRNGDLIVGSDSTWYTDALEGELYLRDLFSDDSYVTNGSSLDLFGPTIVTDSATGKKSTSIFMNILTMMKEFYNDPSSPIYDSSFQKFIGSGGRELEHLGRTSVLENIHAKHGWHRDECRSWGYQKPENLLIYYGYPNSFNSGTNGWSNEKVAQDMAKYGLIIFGNGVQDPTHPDYSNTQIIIPRIKALNPSALIFGYTIINQSYSDFQTKVDQWNTLQVHGILCDQAGYDYGTVGTNSREAFNQKMDYIHGKTYSNLAFINCWNMDHVIGTADDASYPNTTWNPSLLESKLTANDWYLLESFPINTAAYSGNNGYESKSDWATRGTKAQNHRYTYGINLASVGIINNDNSSGQALFDFQYVSSCMFALEAVGTSDTSYGSGSAAVTFWTRPNISDMGRIWELTTAVQVDTLDSDVYWRYSDFGRFKLDFSSGAQIYSISKY